LEEDLRRCEDIHWKHRFFQSLLTYYYCLLGRRWSSSQVQNTCEWASLLERISIKQVVAYHG
jgi:hypothetical protein